MSRLIKVAAILAVAAATLAAWQATMPGGNAPASARAAVQTIAPFEMMRAAGPLPQTEVESYF